MGTHAVLRTVRVMSEDRAASSLTPAQVNTIRHTWRIIESADPLVSASCFIRHLTSLAPTSAGTLLRGYTGTLAPQLIASFGDILSELTAPRSSSIQSDDATCLYEWSDELVDGSVDGKTDS